MREKSLHEDEEKRLTPRRLFEQVVRLEWNRIFAGNDGPVHEIGQVVDISPLGMGVKTDSPLQPREMVRVYLPIQDVEIPLPVFSEVRWVESSNNYFRVGLQFLR